MSGLKSSYSVLNQTPRVANKRGRVNYLLSWCQHISIQLGIGSHLQSPRFNLKSIRLSQEFVALGSCYRPLQSGMRYWREHHVFV